MISILYFLLPILLAAINEKSIENVQGVDFKKNFDLFDDNENLFARNYMKYQRSKQREDLNSPTKEKLKLMNKADRQYALQNLVNIRNVYKEENYKKQGENSLLENTNQNTKFADSVLKQHNKYRKIHDVQMLQLDDKINKVSQEWSDHLAKTGNFQHRLNGSYGENLFYLWHSDKNYKLLEALPVDEWYKEIKYYKYGEEPNYHQTGHFTQVVWKRSKYLGVGYTKNGSSHYVVCNYNPPGNYIGQFDENVPPPKKCTGKRFF